MDHGMIFSGQLYEHTGYTPESILADPKRSYGGHKIATHLRAIGWDVEVIDFVPHFTVEELKLLWAMRYNKGTKFLGVSSLFQALWAQHMNPFLEWVKEKYPDVTIIAGGPIVTTVEEFKADYYIQGWGEYAIVELLNWLHGSGKRPIISKHINLNGEELQVIDALHFYKAYPKEELPTRYQERDFIQPDEFLNAEFSRGCVFKCKFCAAPALGVTKDYTRTAQCWEDELRYNYDNFGVTNYISGDETTNDYTEKLRKYADVTKKLPFKPFITGFARGDIAVAKPEQWEHMIAMGFTSHHYGIESFNEKSAKWVHKGMAKNRLREGLLEMREYFNKNAPIYKTTMSLISGLPYDTWESLNETKDWLFNHWRGQSVYINPLLIQPKGHTSDSMSKLPPLSYNYEELGYIESDVSLEEWFPSHLPRTPENIEAINRMKDVNFRASRPFFWKNDRIGMNFFDLLEWSQRFNNEFIPHQGVSNWYIPYWKTFAKKSFGEISDIVGQPLPEYEPIKEFLDNYKEAKLSL